MSAQAQKHQQRVLVANRGEVAVRVIRAAQVLGWSTVAVAPLDDLGAGHVRGADQVVILPGEGVAAYLDLAELVAAATSTGCSLLHPGWGFASEDAELARRCIAAGVTFVGPSPEMLETFGDKVAARALASKLGLDVAAGTVTALGANDVESFRASLGPGRSVILKALHGGGGRGIRVVTPEDDLADAFRRSRAQAALGGVSGGGALYVEELITGARHIEVQVAGDHSGAVTVIGDRDCSVQRRHQKLLEIAPAPGLSDALRARLADDSLRLLKATGLNGLATVEFLLDRDGRAVFIEVNPRLQVEHPVTEAVTGLDLVVAQLRLASGSTLDEVGIESPQPGPAGLKPAALRVAAGCAIELRVNAEGAAPDATLARDGVVTTFVAPGGPGVRIDTHVSVGYRTHPAFDSSLAKIIVHAGDLDEARRLALTALDELEVGGIATNAALLAGVLDNPLLGQLDTGF